MGIYFALWMLVVMRQILASQDVLYFKRLQGESVDLPCVSEERGSSPIGLYLKRKSLGPDTDVVIFSEDGAQVMEPADEGRVQVHGDLSTKQLNVSISQLQRRDTALYFCQFVYAEHPTDEFIAGKTSLFLFVEIDSVHCSCSSYPPLLYAISAAVGLLFLILIGFCAMHCRKPSNHSKPQTLVPIYEEMTGPRPANGKAPHRHLDSMHQEETDPCVYENPQIKQRQENYYVSPRGTRLTQQSSDTAGEDKK